MSIIRQVDFSALSLVFISLYLKKVFSRIFRVNTSVDNLVMDLKLASDLKCPLLFHFLDSRIRTL